MENMTDSGLLDRVIDHASEEGMWHGEVQAEELKTTMEGAESGDLRISEGRTAKIIGVRAVNLISLAIGDPQWTFERIRTEAPNNGEDLLESFDFGVVNSPAPQVREGKYDYCRTRGFVREVARLAMILDNDSREENYAYRMYRGLAVSETKLNVGVNPLGKTKEFYMVNGPVRILTEDAEEESDYEVNSAGDW